MQTPTVHVHIGDCNCNYGSEICRQLASLEYSGFHWKSDDELVQKLSPSGCCGGTTLYLLDGNTIIAKLRYFSCGDHGELTSFCVRPDYRGKGYGKLLMAAFNDPFNCVRNGEQVVRLNVDEEIACPEPSVVHLEHFAKYHGLPPDITMEEYETIYAGKLIPTASFEGVKSLYEQAGFVATGEKESSDSFVSHVLEKRF